MVKLYTLPEYDKINHNRIGHLYYNAIIDLMQRNTVSQISVQMILDATQTSRSTFYNYFSDKFALMHYVYYHDVMTDNLRAANQSATSVNFYRQLFAYTDQNSFENFYRRFWLNCYKQDIIEHYGAEAYDNMAHNTLVFYINGCYNLLKDYVVSNFTSPTAVEVCAINNAFFPRQFKELLNEATADQKDMLGRHLPRE